MTTSNKKSKRQSLLAILLIAAIAVTGAFAFLTATTETKVNKFTVGSITVDLDEGPWDPDKAENLVSGQIVEKAPSIINSGSADAYGFIVIEVPKADVVVTDAAGNKSDSAVNELFTMHKIVNAETGATEVIDTTADPSYTIGDWTLVESDTTSSEDANYYVFSYKDTIGKDDQTSTLFDKVQFAYVTEEFAGDTNKSLTITATAVAIQADADITSSDIAWNTLKADDTFKGSNIYPIV